MNCRQRPKPWATAFHTLILGVLLFAGTLAVTTNVHAQTVYSFGVVPQFEARKLASIWVPILAELEQRTGLKFKMVGSPEIPGFEESFMNGEFDFAYMNSYHAMLAGAEEGYIPLIRDGGRKLFGILVVRKDNPIAEPKELNGKKVAFPAPNALGASLVMRADLATIFDVKVAPVYVQTHSSVYLNVLLGRATAGGGVMGTFNNQKDEVKDQLRVLYKTRDISPHPVTVHPRVPKDVRNLVQKAFLEMGTTENGIDLLSKIPIKKIVPASIDDYRTLAEWGLGKYYQK